jgi:hypothetical protein
MPAPRFTDLESGAASAAARFATQEGDLVFDVTNSSPSTEAVDLLACEVLADLYRAYCGAAALAVRAYRDDDALLLLLRFDPEAPSEGRDGSDHEVPTAVALRAMPGMVASAVEARTGVRLAPGNLSMCSARGLAVFAFSVLGDDCEGHNDDDPFRLDTAFATARPMLRLAS